MESSRCWYVPHANGRPDMIMIDEPTEGLAPKVVEQVSRLLEEIASRGVAILLVEQKLNVALRISHRLYVMGHGQIVYEGTPATLKLAEKSARMARGLMYVTGKTTLKLV